LKVADPDSSFIFIKFAFEQQ